MAEIYALYRKYRPQDFDEVVGQEKAVSSLKNAILNGQIFHAYLFVGSKGIGKTTLARIMAKKLNISEKDIYELDAASHSGVEDIREITESAYSLPFESKYKMYILDEVHMLSKSAFNALLKTLEEPPAHVIFALATTEFDKIPETIVSRCQTFFLQTPDKETLIKHIKDIAKKEGKDIEDKAAEMIAIASSNSFRNALVNLQRVFSNTTENEITQKEVANILDVPPITFVGELAEAFVNKDIKASFEIIDKIAKSNTNFDILFDIFSEFLEEIFIYQQTKNESLLNADKEQLNKIKNIQNILSSESLIKFLSIQELIKSTNAKKLVFEVGIVEALKM